MEAPFCSVACEKACCSGDLAAVQACILGKRGVCGTFYCFRAAWQGGHMHVLRWLASEFGAVLASHIHTACVHGWLGFAQWLHSANEHARFAPTADLFRTVCAYGFGKVAHWLHGFGITTAAWRAAAFPPACENGHLKVAQWLYSLGPVDIHADRDHAFRGAVFTSWQSQGAGYTVGRWLLSLDPEYTAWPEHALGTLRQWTVARHAWMRSVVCNGQS